MAKVWGVVVVFAKGPDSNALWDYAVRRGWEDAVHVVSGLDELLRLTRGGKVEVVLANSLIGLGQSVPHLVRVLREFVSLRVVLIIPGAGIDTSKMPGQVFLDTLDAIEAFRHGVAEEAIKEGLSRARRHGVRLGRPVIRNAHRDDVARLRAQGYSGRAIGKELGIPSSTASKIISQPSH